MMHRAIALLFLLAAIPQPATEWDQWRDHRRTRLLADDSWLTLVGLYWLHDGTNDVTLPANPPIKAQFILKNGRVTLLPAARLNVKSPLPLRDDTESSPTFVRAGTLSLVAIKRGDVKGDHYGIRVKDSASEGRKNFKPLDYFSYNPAFRVTAHFEPYNPPHKISITNVLGMTTDEISPGALVFKLGGKTYRIDPIWDQSDPEPRDLFIIFKDATSGKETYGAARYLYAHPPDATGNAIVDFNRSYNPPCVFTPYATCPLPPPQNRLPIRVEAGEKKYAGHA
jgi:uncharacterized protein (DUF1684 family)